MGLQRLCDDTPGGRVSGVRMDVGSSRFCIQSRRPIYRCNRLTLDELTRFPVQIVEVAVLVHLHDDLPLHSADLDIRKRQVLDGVKIPRVTRSALEMPLQLAAVEINSKDRCDVEVVEG